jgi:7-carboxy-7-deazaguanine synthase
MLRVNEIFETIQGEGKFTGTPSTFIRLQGCSVGCPWCDTKHTWPALDKREISIDAVLAKGEHGHPTWAKMSATYIAARLSMLRPRHFVLTGGEPCEQDILDLTRRLADVGTVQLETSGTFEISVDGRTFVTLSPKIDMPGGLKVLPQAIERADEIKFPIETAADVEKLDAILRPPQRFSSKVWLQPVSQGKEATEACIALCMARNWKLSLQAHKYAGLR